MPSAGKSPRKDAGKPAPIRSRRRPEPLYRSAKLWVGVGLLAILLGALWWNRREPASDVEPSETASGLPVPLSEAQAVDEAPRLTSVPDSRLIDVSDDPRKGDPGAAVRIVEFADFQCPSCGQFFTNTHGALNALYGERIEWVFLDFPLTQVHNRALPAAIAASCAHRQGKFWPYHDLLFMNQNRLLDGDLQKYAEQAGLDREQWEACFKAQETRAEVEQDLQLGDELGVDATPTFFIGGERLKGALPVTAFMEVIDPLLKSGGGGEATDAPATPPDTGP